MLAEFWRKVAGHLLALTAGLSAGLLTGLLLTVALNRQASAPRDAKPDSTPFDIARLSPAELETLALDVLTTLNEKRVPAADVGSAAGKSSCEQTASGPRQVRLGMNNVRRLLPLAKKLTLESLKDTLKTSRLSREKRLITSVRRIVLDPNLGNAAQVWEDDLSIIHVGPAYAACLTSDDEAMLLLGHELTHVAARTGRLKHLIAGVSDTARQVAGLELDEEQQEELACEFSGAQVLKRYIALHPTARTNTERFLRAFGYEPPPERLAHAWQDFCASYNGTPLDEGHLSQNQTFRALTRLDPELKALIPADAIWTRFCH